VQKVQRFVADQRYDLPQHESMSQFISQEFYNYNKSFFSPQNRILKNWVVENNGGLQIRVNNTSGSFLFASERTGFNGIVDRVQGSELITLNLADNATNYVEVKIVDDLCAEDTVAVWDTSANGGVGEEFSQNIMTVKEQAPVLVSNVVGFTGDADKLPLAIVTTAGGAIASIVDQRKILFELESDWNFGTTRTDRTIDSLKSAYDAITTALKEAKGTSTWYSKPWGSAKEIKEYQNMFFYSNGTVGFEGVNGANNIAWTSQIKIEMADRPHIYVIEPATIQILDGQALYVAIPEGAPPSSLTVKKTDLQNVPISPDSAGWEPGIQVLFFRRGSTVYGMMDIPELSSGETGTIGTDLPQDLRVRLGILAENSYQEYTSVTNFLVTDNYPTAISKLDAALNVIQSNAAQEENFTVGVGGQSVFTTTNIEFSASNAIPDIQVYVNGQKQIQAQDGVLNNADFIKNTIQEIEFSYTVAENAIVTIRQERTGAGGGLGASVDLENIVVNPAPFVNGNKTLGQETKAWGALYLKDTNSAQVYKIEMISGVFTITPI